MLGHGGIQSNPWIRSEHVGLGSIYEDGGNLLHCIRDAAGPRQPASNPFCVQKHQGNQISYASLTPLTSHPSFGHAVHHGSKFGHISYTRMVWHRNGSCHGSYNIWLQDCKQSFYGHSLRDIRHLVRRNSDLSRRARKVYRTSTARKEEVMEIVQTSTDPDELRLVFQSFPSVRKFLLDILSTRSDRDDLLYSLPQSLGDVNKLDVPKQPETRYMLIADTLDEEMHTALIEMDYTALVEGTFAYSPDAVDKLIDVAMNRRLALLHGYLLDPQCVVTYKLVEEELRQRNPLAHWIVKHSLYGHDTPAREVLEFLFEPIKDLFAREDLRLIPMLRLLVVTIASRRYDRDGNLGTIFYRPSPFIQQIFLKRPEEVAHQMTIEDGAYFQQMCNEDLECESLILRSLNKRWSRLSDHVKTCSITVPEYIGHISQVAQVLFTSGNDYSGMALLQGFKSAECKPDGLEPFWEFINSDNNYAAYRKRSTEVRAKLLFPFPLIWRLRQQQEAAKTQIAKDLRLQQAAETARDLRLQRAAEKRAEELTWWQYTYKFLLGRRRVSYKGQQALDIEKADCYL